MPAFAPLLRPELACGLIGWPFAVAAATLGGPDDEEDGEVEGVVVGGDVDVDEDVVVAAASDVDHVVAERSDLQWSSKSAYIL